MQMVGESRTVKVSVSQSQCVGMGIISVAITQRQGCEDCTGDVIRMDDPVRSVRRSRKRGSSFEKVARRKQPAGVHTGMEDSGGEVL